jgi:hypothetical protein
MLPDEKRMIMIQNVDNGYIVYGYEGTPGTPATHVLVAKNFGEALIHVQSLESIFLPVGADVDAYLKEVFKMEPKRPTRDGEGYPPIGPNQ